MIAADVPVLPLAVMHHSCLLIHSLRHDISQPSVFDFLLLLSMQMALVLVLDSLQTCEMWLLSIYVVIASRYGVAMDIPVSFAAVGLICIMGRNFRDGYNHKC